MLVAINVKKNWFVRLEISLKNWENYVELEYISKEDLY